VILTLAQSVQAPLCTARAGTTSLPLGEMREAYLIQGDELLIRAYHRDN